MELSVPLSPNSPHGVASAPTRLTQKRILIACAVAAGLIAVRVGLKSQTAKKVVGTVLKGALAGAARALPRLVLLEAAERARRK